MSEEEKSIQLPEAFLAKMKGLLGEEFEDFVRSFGKERVHGLRFNTLKGSVEAMEQECRERLGLRPVPWCAEGFYYRPESRPGRHVLHEAGAYYIQEPSAMAVVSLLDPRPGDAVLDLCAAPGGKTTHAAERLRGEGLLVCNEIHPARAKILSQNVERMGIQNAVVTNEDSGKLLRYFPGFFNRIVVDAPCSGEGMFRKDEQARAEWSEENVRLCAARQQEILDNAAGMLKPGGTIVYSTCTFSPEEDEGSVSAFLERHPEFSVVRVPEEKKLPGLCHGRPEWSPGCREELAATFRIWPHRAEGEGHFLALLRKDGADEPEAAGDAGKMRRSGKSRGPRFWDDRAGLKILQEFLDATLKERWGTERLVLFGDQIYRLPEGMIPVEGLRVLRPGLHLGTLKKGRLEPSHSLALALHPGEVRQVLRLDPESRDAAAYLAGSTLPVDSSLRGWVLVCAGDYSLGWGKAAGGVLKNHYPKGLRIM